MSTPGLFQALDGLDIDTLPYVMVTTECFCGPTLAARADMDAGSSVYEPRTSFWKSCAAETTMFCSACKLHCSSSLLFRAAKPAPLLLRLNLSETCPRPPYDFFKRPYKAPALPT